MLHLSNSAIAVSHYNNRDTKLALLDAAPILALGILVATENTSQVACPQRTSNSDTSRMLAGTTCIYSMTEITLKTYAPLTKTTN